MKIKLWSLSAPLAQWPWCILMHPNLLTSIWEESSNARPALLWRSSLSHCWLNADVIILAHPASSAVCAWVCVWRSARESHPLSESILSIRCRPYRHTSCQPCTTLLQRLFHSDAIIQHLNLRCRCFLPISRFSFHISPSTCLFPVTYPSVIADFSFAPFPCRPTSVVHLPYFSLSPLLLEICKSFLISTLLARWQHFLFSHSKGNFPEELQWRWYTHE